MIQEENLFLLQNRDNIVQFDITVEGTSEKEPRVRVIVETSDGKHVLDCESIGNSVYNCNIPKDISNKEPQYMLEVIADGFLFEVQKGEMKLTNKANADINESRNLDITKEELEALLEVERKKERLKLQEEQTREATEQLKKQQEQVVVEESVMSTSTEQPQVDRNRQIQEILKQEKQMSESNLKSLKMQAEIEKAKQAGGIQGNKSKFFDFL